MAAPHGGAADAYYQSGAPNYAPTQAQQAYYGGQPQQQPYSQQPYGQQPPYPQAPPPQNYQQANYTPQGYDNNPTGEKQDFNQAFAVDSGKPKWNDLWAAILFLLVFGGFVAVSGWTLKGYVITSGDSSIDNNRGLGRLVIVLFAYVLAVAFVISFLYLLMVRHFTKQIIWITGILQIVFGIGTAIFYLWAKAYGAGIVFLIFAVFYIICFISWIPRIPFSVLMLQTVIDVSKNYGHVFLVSLIGGIVATAFGAWWSITLVAVYARYTPGNASCEVDGGCSQARVIGLIVFITFAGYWITEVLKNIIHVTIAGVYGSWYFCSQKPAGFPSNATRGAFKRSVTHSFGSISFGSLLVAIVQLMRQACNIAKQNQAAEGNLVGVILFWILGCFIGILDWLIQFFNEYAFCYIALYGKAYVPAAKSTWHMMRNRGLDALVNECLINPVLTMGSLFVAYLCALMAYLYIRFDDGVLGQGNYTAVVMAFAFLIGLQVCNIFLVPVKSGTSTFFVAMAFDPQVLMREFPAIWQRMVEVYPRVQEVVKP